MRWSEYCLPTLKEEPKEAEVASHKLMIRAGLIRKLASGIYSYLSLGLKVLKNIEEIIRKEMNEAGALEVLLPALQPLEIWQRSKRDVSLIEDVGFSFKDRHNNSFVLGPTHEEVITDLVAHEINSYRQLPLILYQIQTKFRDEPRPRFGVIRSKEFIMKDAYSFDKDESGLKVSYEKMDKAYRNIMNACGLDYIVVEASSGMMGGKESAEFMILTESGEDMIAYCKKCGYAASLEAASCLKPPRTKNEKTKVLKEVDTPSSYTVEQVTKLLNQPASMLIKTLIYKAGGDFVAVLIMANKRINEAKLQKVLAIKDLRLANEQEIERVTKAPIGFSGPVNLKDIKIIADYQVVNMSNFTTGANKKDKHLINVNLDRDVKIDKFYDLRYIDKEDICPKCKGKIVIKRTMEIGHIFKLGTKYSEDLGANFLDKDGKKKPIIMGCYGIGVNRLLAASIELHHDDKGIIWPENIAPFKVLILPLDKNSEATKIAEKLYKDLKFEKIEVLLDDRDLQAGVKFKDADLIGIPYQVIIGPRDLKKNKVEIKIRKNNKREVVDKEKVIAYIKDLTSASLSSKTPFN